MTIYQHISGLIHNALDTQLIDERDSNYCLNQLLGLLQLHTFPETPVERTDAATPTILANIISFAIENKLINDQFDDKEILSAKIMDIFIARPSVIEQKFTQHYEVSPEMATNYFYSLSKHSNYIQMERIKKNIHFKTETTYGQLDITINLSKPEKDPEQIKRERATKQAVKYPKCLLCAENEGYIGRTGHPARSNHRIIPVSLQDETWYLQYSPYVYYNEHCILLAKDHRSMKINQATFTRLLAFVDKFPHYFIGSNADLPIVGGSILTHDHYQGGHYTFAMEQATPIDDFRLDSYPNVGGQLLKWPLSVIRLTANNQQELVDCATHILATWRTYTDESVGIIAQTEETIHNTITPIARMRDGQFELDLVLRNNRTTVEHPLGIFHPHQDVQHIKKENIGLIEVMGLAVLPARLQTELSEVKQFLLGEDCQVTANHQQWAQQLKEKYGVQQNAEITDEIIETELGNKFTRVLEDAGVYKQTKEGITAFKRFIQALQ